MEHAEAYKAGFPDAKGSDFPDFVAMDRNGNNEVTFDEWLQYVMKLKAAKDMGE